MPPHHGSPFVDDTIEGKGYDGRLVRRLLSYVAPHRKLVILAMLFMVVSTGVELLLPYITKQGIDKYLAKLYQVYSDTPAACDELMALEPGEGDFLRLSPDT
ncbi:MAG TPA: hypothetical protein P5207_00645, partial [Candidatus Sabulitectum sp.]|nr:hypothetical protein [Candidatus Sabulitectum sp.]